MKTDFRIDKENKKIYITREFNALLEQVWKAWTTASILEQWFAPKPWRAESKEMNFREGGSWLYCMVGPTGERHWAGVEFIKIDEFKSYQAEDYFCDENGNKNPEFSGMRWNNNFSFSGNKTKVDIIISFDTLEDLEKIIAMGFKEGFTAAHANLDDYFNKAPFSIERIFNASREVTWKAISDKNEMKKWYFDLKEFKPEVGAEFRFFGGHEDGIQYEHICVIKEVIINKKLSYSWRYAGYEGDSLVIFELFEEGDKTKVKLTHEGLETFPANNKDFAKYNFAEGWTMIIGTMLKDYLEKN